MSHAKTKGTSCFGGIWGPLEMSLPEGTGVASPLSATLSSAQEPGAVAERQRPCPIAQGSGGGGFHRESL